MKGIIFDIETNGLLHATDKTPALDRVHCLAMVETDGGEVRSFGGHTDEKIRGILSHLEDAPLLINHNIKRFDIPALQKVYPNFKPKGIVRDTLCLSQLIWPDIKTNDFKHCRTNHYFPKKMIGRHSLEAWGYRLGVNKGDFGKTSDWAEWSEEMQRYCEQDVRVTQLLWKKICSKNYAEEAIQLEHDFLDVLIWQENNGFPFDEEGAKKLYSELTAERFMLDRELAKYFPPYRIVEKFTPKVNNKRLGYVRGVTIDKVQVIDFNPTSREQIAERLMKTRGWNPTDFTETGRPTVNDDVLELLKQTPENPDGWPECNHLQRHLEIEKIIGMLAEGKKAWLKLVRNGRIHGEVVGNGTVTGRCAHKNPNLGQIPKEGDLGKRCRALFTSIPGYKLVGADASGLELRMLGHFMARYDGGEYVLLVTTGDVHTANQKAAGLPTRSKAKTFIYGWLYGAGDEKIGTIVELTDAEVEALFSSEPRRREYAINKLVKDGRKPDKRTVATIIKGGLIKAQFLKGLPALALLKDAVADKVRRTGQLTGLDGRVLSSRSPHSALNLLLQSAGALVMKKAMVLRYKYLLASGAIHRRDVCQVVNVHDEMQDLVREGMEKEIGELSVKCIEEAGQYFKLRCPLAGEWKSGDNWKDTH